MAIADHICGFMGNNVFFVHDSEVCMQIVIYELGIGFIANSRLTVCINYWMRFGGVLKCVIDS